MTDVQSRTEKMGESTLVYLDDNATIWNGNAITVLKRDALEAKLDEINAIEILQVVNTTGNAEQKAAMKQLMAEEGVVISNAMQVFARDNNDPVLLREIDFALTALARAKDSDAQERCAIIHDRATTHSVALAAYGITSGMITSLEQRIEDFHDSLGTPKAAKSATAAATKDLETAFEELNVIFESLDSMIDLHRFNSKTFWEGYKTVRKRDETGVRHQSARVTLIDKVTKAPIPQGTLTVNPKGLTKKFSKLGVVTLFDSETGTGTFTFIASAQFYKEAKVPNVVLETGKVVRVTIELEQA